MHMYFSAVSQQPKSRGSDMEPLCSQSEAFGVVNMALSCCQSDPHMTPQTLELKKELNVTECAALLKQQSRRLSKPRTKYRARCAAYVAAAVVSHSHSQSDNSLSHSM